METKQYTDPKDDDIASECAPLYENEDFSSNLKRTRDLITLKALLFHLGFFAVHTLFFVYILFSRHSNCTLGHTGVDNLSPAAEAIRFKRLSHSIDAPSIYKGDPSPELDSAWDQLLQGYNLRISLETLNEMGRKSIELADGSGDYWGILDSFHNLHCLKMIRHYLAPGHYQHEYSSHRPEDGVYPPHIEHCVESLRLYIMCKGDITIQTFDWIDDEPKAKANYTSMEHQCVDWPRLQAWAIKHSFHLTPETISHPKYGFPYGSK